MKLWLLRPREDLPEDSNPWEPWYDKTFGFVVRAENEEAARSMIDMRVQAGDENHAIEVAGEPVRPWSDPRYSTCVELKPKGETEVIMRDIASA